MFSHRPIVSTLSAALICCFCLPAIANTENNTSSGSYYERGAEGWFWYQDPEPEEEPEEKPEEEKEEPSVVKMEPPKDAPKPKPEPKKEEKEPEPLTAAWFRSNVQKYLDKAIDNPTKENVEAYYLLQRVMLDKAETFADVAGKVVAGDKLLDEVSRRSLDSGTANRTNTIAAKNTQNTIRDISDKAGIFFFFSEDCVLCYDQARILAAFEETYDMEIVLVSQDGSELKQQDRFKNKPIRDQGQAEKLNIDKDSPAIVLASPPDMWRPISYGVINQSQLMNRVIDVAHDEGIISEEAYNSTKAVKENDSLANKIKPGQDVPEDSEELIRLLRSMGE